MNKTRKLAVCLVAMSLLILSVFVFDEFGLLGTDPPTAVAATLVAMGLGAGIAHLETVVTQRWRTGVSDE